MITLLRQDGVSSTARLEQASSSSQDHRAKLTLLSDVVGVGAQVDDCAPDLGIPQLEFVDPSCGLLLGIFPGHKPATQPEIPRAPRGRFEKSLTRHAAALNSPTMTAAPEISTLAASAVQATCNAIVGERKSSQTFDTSGEMPGNLLKLPQRAGNLRKSLRFSVIQAISA
jgi:hypothetical protein